ncbi:AI-2E family transporter [Palleronia caenipelagi]|uniref:AI-2E family transporter n=1 Tax=Palleronia caenipelagi TaxID=2489174 RepID=A0A547PRA5_9RHOB|nr:AI-2E family transporter [Palleronia caenipelagi]TRD16673.1 AI-2E family transporter [Palleronia caenipelagi]
MSVPVKQQVLYWSIAALVFILLLMWLGNVITPFILGAAIAYLLDPIADRLQEKGLSRALAVAIISVIVTVIFVGLILLVIPTLISQLAALSNRVAELIDKAPLLVGHAQSWLVANVPFVAERFPEVADLQNALERFMSSFTEALRKRSGALIEGVTASVSGIIGVITVLVIAPVVSVYLLFDWDRMVAEIDSLLPRQHAPTIRKLASDIDTTLSSFLRGQGLVCLILGTYYAIALTLVGLQFGFVIGVIAGALTFIPYVGALVGALLSIGMALFQFWGEWWMILIVYAIFQSGQAVEGNILTPKLVGSSVGLHPVWLLFALTAFGSLFGFVGMLVAVPVAAVLGVVARFLIGKYRNSALYLGEDPNNSETSE